MPVILSEWLALSLNKIMKRNSNDVGREDAVSKEIRQVCGTGSLRSKQLATGDRLNITKFRV